MAFERVRAHSAVLGAFVALAVGAVSVGSLVVAEGRLEQFDQDRHAGASTAPASAAVTSTTAVAPTTTTTVVARPPSGLPTQLLDALNATRIARGLAPLTWNDGLSASAQRVSDTMAASGVVVPPDLGPILALGYARAAENVLAGPYAVTAPSVVSGWMGSPQHRAAILDAALRDVGIGATSTPDQRIWITVHFGG